SDVCASDLDRDKGRGPLQDLGQVELLPLGGKLRYGVNAPGQRIPQFGYTHHDQSPFIELMGVRTRPWAFHLIRATKKPLHEEEANDAHSACIPLISRVTPQELAPSCCLDAGSKGCRVSSGQSLHHSG